MTVARFGHAASLLSDGKVLITGGFVSSFTISGTAELFDPGNNSFTATGSMTDARSGHSSTGLSRPVGGAGSMQLLVDDQTRTPVFRILKLIR